MLVTDFGQIVERALRSIPARFRSRMNNVAVVVEAEPHCRSLRPEQLPPEARFSGCMKVDR